MVRVGTPRTRSGVMSSKTDKGPVLATVESPVAVGETDRSPFGPPTNRVHP